MTSNKQGLSNQNKKNPEIEIKTKTGEKFDVPLEGSLGLLA
jgi:hypothetical protein